MKKHKILYFLILLFPMYISCKKSFLNGEPYSATSTDNFYKTAVEAEQALTGAYSILNAGLAQGQVGGFYNIQFPTLGTAATDEMVTADGKNDANYAPIGLGAWNSQTAFINDVWTFLYIGINRNNLLLEKLPQIDMPLVRKKQIMAEAHFLRGLEYLYLGMMYGGVPVVTVSDPEYNLPRNTVQEVFMQVIADLEFAHSNLTAVSTGPGRANKYAAAGILAKAYLFAASCKNNNVNTNLHFPINDFTWVNSNMYYNNALALTTEIINSGKYQLIPKYDYLFRETTKTYQYEEFIFNTESSSDPANGNQPTYQPTLIPLGSNANFGGGTCRIVPTGELFAKYSNSTVNKTFTDYRKLWNFSNQMGNNPAYETVEGVGYYVPASIATFNAISGLPNTTVTSKAWYGSKFRYRDPKLKKFTINNTDDNFPILRYAEVLLMHAEAIFFTAGNVSMARSFLSQIRQRAITTTLTQPSEINAALATLNAEYSKTDFVQELLDERARELCFEGNRHFDLVRFGRYISTINSLSNDRSVGINNTVVNQLKTNLTPNKIWFPIPYQQILIEPALIQNPGY